MVRNSEIFNLNAQGKAKSIEIVEIRIQTIEIKELTLLSRLYVLNQCWIKNGNMTRYLHMTKLYYLQ